MKLARKGLAKHSPFFIDQLEIRVLLSGELDPTFGIGGFTQGPASPDQSSYTYTVSATEADGKLLALGTGSIPGQFAFCFLADGMLDTSFGSNGIASVGQGSLGIFIEQSASGNYFVATQDGNPTFNIYDLNNNGSFDTAFGTNGAVTLPSGDVLNSGTVDGNNLLVGVRTASGGNQVMRYTPTGALDPTFGTAGVLNVSGTVGTMVVTTAGQIVLYQASSDPSANGIYRYNSDGSADTSFGVSGRFADVTVHALLPQTDTQGRLYYVYTVSSASEFDSIYRLTAEGLLDPSFHPIDNGLGNVFAAEPDGSVLAAVGQGGNAALTITHYTSSGVADGTTDQLTQFDNILPFADGSYLVSAANLSLKLTAANVPDGSFGSGGSITALNAVQLPDKYSAIGTQSDGKIITAAIANGPDGNEFYVSRFNIDGSIDTTFGTSGASEFPAASLQAESVTMLVEPDNDIVIAGNISNPVVAIPGASSFTIARLTANGSVDSSFGSDGSVTYPGDTNPALFWQDGKVLIGSTNTLRRLNDNGTVDSTFASNLPGSSTYAVGPDGKILDYFSTVDPTGNTPTTISIRRYSVNGTLDSTFGNAGVQLLDPNYVPGVEGIFVEQNGTIVLSNGQDIGDTLTALNTGGSEDTAFGTSGSVLVGASGDDAPDVLQQSDGKLLVVQQPDAKGYWAHVVRYTAAGELDMSFDETGSEDVGMTPDPYAQIVNAGNIATLDNQQRLLLAGGFGYTGASIFAVQTTGNLVPGPATTMQFVSEPTDQFTGQLQNVVIAIEDANGALASTDGSRVSIMVNGAGSLVLDEEDVSAGFVLAKEAVPNTGTNCTVTASDSEVPTITSSPFDISAPVAFVQQPTGKIGIGPIAPIIVDILNLDGSVDTTNDSYVTLRGQGYFFSGTTTVAAVNGVATFSGLSTLEAGSNYSLEATVGAASYNSPATFSVEALSQLSFTTSPANVVAAGALGTVTVELLDQDGDVVSTNNSDVTLTLAGGTAGASLGGTLTVVAVNGVATFSDLSLTTIGNAYSLTASLSGATSAVTPAFNVVPDTTPSALVQSFKTVKLAATNVAGTTLNAVLPIVITNQGATFKGTTTIRIFADSTTMLDGEQVLISTVEKKFGLKPGKKQQFNVPVKSLPATLPAGTYHLLAQVTDPTGATNVISTDQTIAVAAPVIEPVVTVGVVTPGTITQAKSGTVLVDVTNSGNVNAQKLILTLAASTDGENAIFGAALAEVKANITLRPGASKRYRLKIRGKNVVAGTYFPLVTISLGGVVVSTTGSETFTVG